MKKALLTAACCAAALTILLGGYFCYAPFWQPDYAPVSPEPFSMEQVLRMDLNTATAEELMTLPGIGEKRAADIIAYREANGPFRIPEDLTRVSGIGEGILAGLIDQVTVSQEEETP